MCLALPDAYEEPAWVGTRWCVRRKTFAHAFEVDDDAPPSIAKIAQAIGPGSMVVFRSSGPELVALRNAGPPFFYAGWGRDVIALALQPATDWDEVTELLTESYSAMRAQEAPGPRGPTPARLRIGRRGSGPCGP